MADVKWNEEQLQAIQAKGCSVLVSAAAGSGKTAVLVERVIRLLVDKSSGVMADQLLIVTFTNLAAEEMKTRINKRITQLLDKCAEDPTIDEAHLRNQQLLLDKANISTIDSFCKEIVKQSYTRFDISPDYRIGDSSELKTLQCQAIEEIAEQFYPRKDFAPIASLLTTTTRDNDLKGEIIEFYKFLSALPFPQQWMDNTIKELENSKLDVMNSQWMKILTNSAISRGKLALGFMSKNQSIFENLYDIFVASPKKLQQHNDEVDFINSLSLCNTREDFTEFLLNHENVFKIRSAPLKVDEHDKDQYEEYKKNRSYIKDVIEELKQFFSYNSQDLLSQLYAITDITKVLFEFVNKFSNQYTLLKKEKNILDFADIERYTLLTLAQVDEQGEFTVDNTPNSIRYNITDDARNLSKTYKQVIVDEYQDVNQLQDLIFKIISNNDKNLFVVGDVKQSIYGFRQAMPDIFIDRKHSYSNSNYQLAQNIVLKKNYRSRYGVTDYVNFVFRQLMKKDLGNLEYTPEDYLVAGATYIGDNDFDVYIHLNNLPVKNSKVRDLAEAECIAKIIKESVGKYDVTTGDTTRKAQYSDVAILMRSVKNTTILVDYLSQQNIPVVTETTSSLLDCKEVQFIINLLRIIDNPLQDIPLYSVLVSPLFGFTPQQIAQLRATGDRKTFLYKNVMDNSKTNPDLKAFVDELEYYREISANNPTDILINIIYQRTAITQLVSALDNGEIILNNLRLLHNYSKNFENEQNKGVTAFIRYIEHAIENNSSLDAQTGSNTDGNAVRVMTMHHSKGLEYPVCILAGLGRKPLNYTNKMYFDRELGIGMQMKDLKTATIYKTFPYLAIIDKKKADSVAEELRVLYVALTRAREQLHLVGSYDNLPKRIKTISSEIALYGEIKSDMLISHNSMLDWTIATSLMMKPEKSQQKNPLWKFADKFFIERIANNNTVNPLPYRDVFTEIIDVQLQETIQEDILNEQTEPLQNIDEYTEIEFTHPLLDITTLDNRFNTEYKYQNSVDVPSVVTPSAIAHSQSKIVYLEDFEFEEKEQLTATQRGTAMHQFMEFAQLHTALVSPQAEIFRLVKEGYLSPKQGECIDATYIKACLETSIMQRYIKSPKKYKEVKFEAMVKATETGFENCNEEHLLRGAVDCAFEENDEIVIIDYKTDRVKTMEQLKEKYAMQLKLYKLGLSATLHKPVKQCVIYSFYLNDFIEV
ncbi:MAG: helicase-exonuclease AddAB subunit AddA [Acutalibacteraceae bacterium]|nr:helicase-exonuclease AddAB subunit AddA [Acutalibacteraceae bacterium]